MDGLVESQHSGQSKSHRHRLSAPPWERDCVQTWDCQTTGYVSHASKQSGRWIRVLFEIFVYVVFLLKVRRGGNSFLVPQENACFSCLDEILTFIKTTMSSASDGDKFELRHDKSNLGVIGLRKIYNTSKLEVVPAWFKEWVSSNRSTQQA